MSIIKNIRNWTDLIAVFQSLKSGYESADIQLRNGIDCLCHKLQQERIIHSSINKRGKTWGAKSLVLCFCEKFDPILEKLFPANSISHQYLNNQQVYLPLINQMQHKENSGTIASGIDRAIFLLESLIPIDNASKTNAPPLQWNKIQSDIENLELVARLISAIYSELGYVHDLNWCSICFRMANKISRYCHIHSSSLDDTAYRKALKLKQTIPSQLLGLFARQRSQRRVLRDTFTIISKNDEVFAELSPDMFCIYVDEVVKNLVLDTKNSMWQDTAQDWDFVLHDLPHVSKRLIKKAVNFVSWPEFSRYTQICLDNHYDDTTHPYWIFMMFVEANVWFKFEDELTLQKAEPKKNEILTLLSKELRNRDIVNQLQVTNSYVSELRKKYNKNRTNN